MASPWQIIFKKSILVCSYVFSVQLVVLVCVCVMCGYVLFYTELRNCVNHPDSFCYIRGEVIFKNQRRNFTQFIMKCYELFFGCKVGDLDKKWAPR